MQVVFPRGMKKVVLGYDWDETFDAVPYRDADDDEEEDESSSQQLDGDNDEESGLQMTAALSLPQQPRRKSMGSREASTGSVHSLSADGLNRRRHDSGDSRLQIV
ncbi:hypothetical protein MPSEU_000547200 [Mayamaea pseudoterrestris]|nr:hypothetical protein MPSEU_000547200 [Mayamaea pseudoterrestris]